MTIIKSDKDMPKKTIKVDVPVDVLADLELYAKLGEYKKLGDVLVNVFVHSISKSKDFKNAKAEAEKAPATTTITEKDAQL